MTKKIMALVLALVMCVALVACGGEPDPNCGTWQATKVVAGEQTIDAYEIYSEFTMVLEDGGVGTLTIDGQSDNIKWSSDEASLTIVDSAKTEAVAAIQDDGLVFVNFGGSGADLYMARAN